MVMENFVENIDKSILGFIQSHIQNPFFDRIIPLISKLGNIGTIWIIISIIFILSKKYRKAGILGICSLLISAVLGEALLKNIIGRPRPFVQAPNIALLIPKPISYSFPSGHTASSFAAAGAFIKNIDNRKITIPLIILACTIAFSRMYLMVHYPTDILGGIILGLISAKLANSFLDFREKRKSENI